MFRARTPFGLAILIVLMASPAADAQFGIRPFARARPLPWRPVRPYPWGGPGVPLPAPGPGYLPNPYSYPPYPYPDWESDSNWTGSAELLNAYANYQVAGEQANLVREKVDAEKLANQKRAADLMRYEQSLLPTQAELQARLQEQELSAALNEPSATDITSGRALNTLLPYLAGQRKEGKSGTDVKLDPEVVAGLNIATPAGRTLGPVLVATRPDQWPAVLRGPAQQNLVDLLGKAVQQAAEKNLDVRLVERLRKETAAFLADFRARFLADNMSVADFYAGKRFLENLQRSCDTLTAPEVLPLLGVTAAADTVDGLVQYLTANGLRFAAALPGQEAAYLALHRAFVQYAHGDFNASGFRVRLHLPNDKAAKGGKGG